MRLARFNEFIVAIAGVAVTIGTLVLMGLLVADRMDRIEPPRGLAIDAGNARDGKKPPQNLVFCHALTDVTGTYQYIPVAAVVAEDAERDPSLGAAEAMRVVLADPPARFDALDAYPYSVGGRTFNVVVRALASNSQRLLLDRPAQIVAMDHPAEKCATGEGRTPCDRLLWHLRTADTNGDGTINDRDALVVHSSGLDAGTLTARTPADATVLGVQWIGRTGAWQFLIRRDSNKDGSFTEEDGTELLEASAAGTAMARPLLQQPVREALDAAIR